MRSLLFSAMALLVLSSNAFGQGYDLNVNLSTGETVTFPIEDIQRIEMYDSADTLAPESIDDLKSQLSGGAKSSSGNIYLSWREPFDNRGVDSYIVYRSDEPGEVGDSLITVTDTFYVDEQVVGSPSIHYYYIVKSIDLSGNKSEPSNQAGEFDKSLSNS